MKKIRIILFLCLLTVGYSCTKKSNEKVVNQEQYDVKVLCHAKMNNIRGNVIEYNEIQFLNLKTGELKGKKTIYRLDSKGNLLEINDSADGIIKISRTQNIEITTGQTIYKVPTSLHMLITIARPDSIVQKSFSRNGEILNVIKYSLDENGYIVKRENTSTFGISEKNTYVNDKYGNCIEKYDYDLSSDKNLPVAKTVYKLDSYGNPVYEKSYNLRENGSAYFPEYEHKYIYDTNGNWLEQYTYENGHLAWRNHREYIYK